MAFVRNIFAPAPAKPMLPDEEVRRRYPRMRMQMLEATFMGYALYYVVRNNLSVVAKDMQDVLHYDKTMIGDMLAMTAISYGVGKFVMGALSDRSNPRVFMAFGLLITALINFAFGAANDYGTHFWLWSINGFIQGMGWPPCGRTMGHWFSERERGLTFSIWNTSHNLGAGLAGPIAAEAVIYFGGWQYAFYVPGAIALIGAVYLFARLRDTPESEGLPCIELYNNDFTEQQQLHGHDERNLTYRELLLDNLLFNKWVLLLAAANFFAYIARYSMLDWGPMYLREVKGASLSDGGIAILIIEFGGIPSTIFFGWISDKIGGRRGMVGTLCMIPIMLAFWAILYIPNGYLWLDMMMLAVIGLFIYPVINLITIIALDLTSKKAIGTAAGFIGLFGYLGRTAQAKGFGNMLHYYETNVSQEAAWNAVFYAILGATFLGMLLMAITWRVKPRA